MAVPGKLNGFVPIDAGAGETPARQPARCRRYDEQRAGR